MHLFVSRLLLLFCLAFFGTTASAQTPSKANLWLRHYLKTVKNPQAMTPLMVRGDKTAILDFTTSHKGVFRHSAAGYHHLSLPAQEVASFAEQPFVEHIDFTLGKGQTFNGIMLQNNRIVDVHAGTGPLNAPVTGKGVLLGFIDTGVEINHPDFTDTVNNQTRILKIWDQTESDDSTRIPPQYGYGKLWDSTDINAGICTHLDASGHGSTVTGSAASNGNGGQDYLGVAPDANIVVVESNFASPNWGATVADAVEWIYAQADSLGMPCVINASIGSYFGSHDGRDAVALLIDSLVTAKRGRAFVCAAGNAGGLPMHLGYDITTDTSYTWFTETAAGQSAFGYDVVYFEGWADTADLNQATFAIGADDPSNWTDRGRTPFYQAQSLVNTTVTDTIFNNGNVVAIVDVFVALDVDRYFFQVHLAQPDSGQYLFRFMTEGSGHFDVWSTALLGTSNIVGTGLPSAAQRPDIIHYKSPDANQTIVSSWNCSEQSITVGNWTGRTQYVDYLGVTNTVGGVVGEIFPGSSEGPTRDNRIKPDVAATGQIALSSGSFYVINLALGNNSEFLVAPSGLHLRNGGTSMASPVVAGIAALYLELCPNASNQEIRQAIMASARTDSSTGTVPNATWGSGKADGFAALVGTLFTPTVANNGDTIFCEGDSVQLIAPAGMATYAWSNGDSSASIWVSVTDTLSVAVVDSMGCQGSSRDYHTEAIPNPTAPAITQDLDTLFSNANGTSFQWYLDGNPIGGATSQNHQAQSSGVYQVEVFNAFGCSALSDTLYLSLVGLDDLSSGHFSLYPNPARSTVNILVGDNPAGRGTLRIYDASGRILVLKDYSAFEAGQVLSVPVSAWGPGLYLLTIEGEHYRFRKRFIKG